MEAREPLPDDLLLEILARCDDAATVVRCAAASKPLRRAILGPGFRNHHHLGHGLGPTAVLGLSFQPHTASTAAMVPTAHLAVSTTTTTSSPPQITRPSVTIIDSGVLKSLEPVASRDGLLVIRRWGDCSGAGLSVRDTLTGDSTSLPSMGLHGRGVFFFPPALLAAAADDHRSFELLAAYSQSGGIKFQIFSAKDATWSAARDIRCHVGIGHLSRAQPAIIGRRVHWLCQRRNQFELSVLAVDADDAAAETMTTATMTPVPAMFRSRMRPSCQSEELHSHVRLVAMGGQLRLLGAESLAVTMWTLTSPTGWDRRVVVGMQELERRAGLVEVDLLRFSPLVFLGFAEKSETVIVLMMERHLVSFNLATRAVTTLWRDGSKLGPLVSQVWLHETDLASVLQAMKSF